MMGTALITLGDDLVGSGALWVLLFLGNVVVLIILALQGESILRTCLQVVEQKKSLAGAAERAEGEIHAASVAALDVAARLPAIRATLGVLGQTVERLAPQLAEAKRTRVREIVLTDVFIPPGDRPFVATVRMPAAGPEEPMAAAWSQGREHVFYAPSLAAAQERFARRFPPERGFVVDEATPFELAEAAAE